jgi:uncharacterized protein (TIGR02145 family)
MKRASNNLSSTLRVFWIVVLIPFLIVSCSSEPEETSGTVTDIDGNVYKTVIIGKQWWMAENLKVTHYRNGESIPNVVDGEEWCNLTSGAYSVYENDSENIPLYGLHYNWYAATDPQGICPEGWHVPSDEEWMELEMYLGMSREEADIIGWRGTDEGGKLKEAGTDLWQNPNTGATNETGFSAVPSGGRASDPAYVGGFFYQGEHTAIWSSDEYSSNEALFRVIEYDQPGIKRNVYRKGNGFSIRCVQD